MRFQSWVIIVANSPFLCSGDLSHLARTDLGAWRARRTAEQRDVPTELGQAGVLPGEPTMGLGVSAWQHVRC